MELFQTLLGNITNVSFSTLMFGYGRELFTFTNIHILKNLCGVGVYPWGIKRSKKSIMTVHETFAHAIITDLIQYVRQV